ncbi:YsnF/AvaK domain-containing protein [Noviherbaspirillum sp.]|uniref:YsnF/AvaK domain-containing protein n=1 Tax=Noviherbaspirillum sp. TaxID=1926288 RepID=UPI002B4907A6|nr:YsnF/AvaK domain-containing protein [Noviherbaspirillum sp.]HJV81913.1 YsnF/AvaK domain-containing protein [Noviherbaspirillum sp.]
MEHFPESGDTSPANRLMNATVVDAKGSKASIVGVQQTESNPHAWVRLPDETQVLVPVSLLTQQDDGSFRLPFTFHVSGESRQPTQMSFPVMEEELHVAKRVIDTGRGVRIHKTVAEQESVVDQPLMRDELVVERVPVGRVVAEADVPQTRYEGDTLIVPVLEEVLVVQKQLVLKEEVRITRQRQQTQSPQTVLLRSEQVTVERFDEGRERSQH